MADELTYSTIVFDKVHRSRPQVRKEEDPIYTNVKTEKSDAPIPEAAVSGTSEKNSPGFSPPKPAIVCLGVLCALILSVSVALCVYFTTHLINTDVMNELELLRDNQTSLITEYQGLKMLYANLTTESEMLKSDEFINSHSLSYYDKWHGYWIGLRTEDGTRRWVNGAPLTEEYWNPNFSQQNMCVLTNSSSNPLESWKSAFCHMRNRWICESNTLIIQN
ncbi:hypothetical protein JZ751_009835 [Albula glossodonta]|uniref:C-type lectin domain-containing protein n=1 Tax=Albula glossodonta TaxID=121402 RepID=A0A8T2NYX5_9TELE|nr:hypothetical protein JZ751_009835 [Albula glossodonta]